MNAEVLNRLSYRQLVAVLKNMRAGSIGFDTGRNPETAKKAALANYIINKGLPGEHRPTISDIETAIIAVTQAAPDMGEPDPENGAMGFIEIRNEPGLFNRNDYINEVPPQPAQEPEKMHQPAQPAAYAPPAAPAAGADPAAIAQLLAALIPRQSPEEVRAMVQAEVRAQISNLPPNRIEIRGAIHGDLQEQTHPMFEKVLRLTSAGLNVLLTGPAGSGKTHLAAQVARAMGLDFGAISITAGASESQLVGRLLPTGEGGRFEYSESPFVRIYENGGVYLIDEIDAGDPNMLLVINTALANGSFYCELRTGREKVVRHEKTILIGAANTFGTGADAMYTGRSQLDAATLDRWYVVQMDYNPALEASIIGLDNVPNIKRWKPCAPPTDQEVLKMGRWVLDLREKVLKAKLRRVVSTRAVQKAVTAHKAGIPFDEVCKDILAGWTRDELSKVGEAA